MAAGGGDEGRRAVTRDKHSRWELVVVSHSHWDREWYFPFQNYRIRLVGMIDRLLDILAADPHYKCFMLDGQTILLEDYVAVRPDKRSEIERLVRGGRLLVGPWYTPPDEFLPSGEALIRNLLWGMQVAGEFGGAMKVGYSVDAFGHIAHLPAILRGFGIEDAVVWRGADERLRKTEFLWQSPDGSAVLALHLPLGYGFAPTLPSDAETLRPMLEWFRGELQPRATTPYLVVMSGTDHSPAQADLPAAIAAANSFLGDAEMTHGSLPMVFEAIRRVRDEKSRGRLRWKGELRSSQRAHILPGAITARMWIKQRNQSCENLLVRWAEPFSVWATLLRDRLGDAWQSPPLPWGPLSRYPDDSASIRGLVRQGWKQLLQNQEHDSIYGCGVDDMYRDVAVRFDGCQQISEDLTRQALLTIGTQVDGLGDGDMVVFNPLNGPRTDFVTVRWPLRDDGRMPVAVRDSRGRRVPCQIISEPGPRYMAIPNQAPRMAELGFVARNVPGYGYKAFRVTLGPRKEAMRRPGASVIENEFFQVTADPTDATVTVRDKQTGRVLPGLNRLVDGGDRGDSYAYWAPERDRTVDAPSGPPVADVVERGPARLTLETNMVYRLPGALNDSRKARSAKTVECAIRSRVSLYPGVRRVDFWTEVDNQALDHRLRVHFPTDVQADVTYAEQHFGVVERPVAVPAADETWMEAPVATYPQKSFVDVTDGRLGVLLANRGLPEYEALPGVSGLTLALTLLRGVGWLCRADMTTRKGLAGPPFIETPDAQCLGRHVFEYSLVPHEGDWMRAFAEAHRFADPLRARSFAPTKGSLPPQGALLEITSPRLVLSGLKFAEDGSGVVARLYNIGDRAIRARVRLVEAYRKVELVDLNESPLAELLPEDGWVEVRAKRNEIVSLLFRASMQPVDAKG